MSGGAAEEPLGGGGGADTAVEDSADAAAPVSAGAPDAVPRHLLTLVNRGGRTVSCGADETVIDACEAEGIALPIACRYGGCITCAARLISGRVRQPNATALNGRQSRAGYVLLCVARPTSDCVLEVGVESHGALYENPFGRPPD